MTPMSVSSSRIPHLARAIVDKRKLRLINEYPKHDLVHQLRPGNISLCNARFYASKAPPARPKPSIKPPVPPRPRPRIQRETAPAPSADEPSAPSSPLPLNSVFESMPQYETYDPDKDPVRKRRYQAGKLGFTMVVVGFIGYIYQSYKNDLRRYYAKGDVLPQDADVSSRWKDTTRDFDREVDASEKLMLMKWKRKRLVREAYGDVLEVSVGTGRNMDLYDTRPYSAAESAIYGRDTRNMITSLTFNDESPVMIDSAKKKWAERQKRTRREDRFAGKVSWYTGDAGQKDVIPRPPGGYDTIVQSWGICSMADPVKFLRHLGRLVRQPGEDVNNSSPQESRDEEMKDGKGGRIFLLEHGRGNYEWMNNFLDKSAPMHADRYGCWYNKDIDNVIQDSGLVVERLRRYNFGTTYEYILRPAPGPLPGEESTTAANPAPEVDKPIKGGWLSWLGR